MTHECMLAKGFIFDSKKLEYVYTHEFCEGKVVVNAESIKYAYSWIQKALHHFRTENFSDEKYTKYILKVLTNKE